jgi:hypothetical protein
MCKASINLKRCGYAAYNPGLDVLEGVIAGDLEYHDYFKPNFEWLSKADALFVLPYSQNSKGVQAEIERAKELKIPVVHSITELEVIKMQGDKSKNEKLR